MIISKTLSFRFVHALFFIIISETNSQNFVEQIRRQLDLQEHTDMRLIKEENSLSGSSWWSRALPWKIEGYTSIREIDHDQTNCEAKPITDHELRRHRWRYLILFVSLTAKCRSKTVRWFAQKLSTFYPWKRRPLGVQILAKTVRKSWTHITRQEQYVQ